MYARMTYESKPFWISYVLPVYVELLSWSRRNEII